MNETAWKSSDGPTYTLERKTRLGKDSASKEYIWAKRFEAEDSVHGTASEAVAPESLTHLLRVHHHSGWMGYMIDLGIFSDCYVLLVVFFFLMEITFLLVRMCMCSCSVMSDSLRPHGLPSWTVAHQAPLSMELSRQEYWSGLPFLSPGDLPDPRIEAGSSAFQADFLLSEPPGIDAFKQWFWRRLLRVPWTARRTNQLILRKSTLNIYWKNWCWNSNILATLCEELKQKRPWCWGRLRARGEGGDRGWHGWMASLTQWTQVWANSGRYEGQGSLVCCSPWGHRELNTTQWLNNVNNPSLIKPHRYFKDPNSV